VTELVEVQLLQLPLDLLARAQEHSEELRREFQLIASPQTDDTSVPARLLALSQQLSGRYGMYTQEADRVIAAARERGEDSVDVTMSVPDSAGDAARALGAMLAEADAFCRDGDLLTLATPEELVRLREWYLDQFITQIEGGPPVPWPQYPG